MARCPVHPDRTPSLALSDGSDGRLLVFCFAGCEAWLVLEELRRRGFLGHRPDLGHRLSTPRPRVRETVAATHLDLARKLWNEALDLRGTIGEIYLQRRGLVLPADVTCLRFHRACPRAADRLPAVVAAIRSATDNKLRAVHRIFLRPDGSDRLRDDRDKLTLGPMADGVVKLVDDDSVTLGLGICEGVEDGLAIIGSGWRPVWATTAGGIARFPVLSGIEHLTIFADGDAPGRKAAEACVARWRAAGRQAQIVEPPPGIKDHNDLVRDAHRA
jgi:putative DNA primase/helicase